MSPLTKTRRRRERDEHAAVRAAGAECRRPVGQVRDGVGRRSTQQALVDAGDAGLGEQPRHEARVELAAERQDVLAAVDLHALQTDLLLEERVELLDHVQLVDLGAEVGDQPLGQRIGHAQLEEAGLRERLPGGAVGRAGGDDAHAGVAHLDAVELQSSPRTPRGRAGAARRRRAAGWRCAASSACFDGSRSSWRSGPAGVTRSPSRATPCECEVRVVVRYSTGVSKRSLSS